VVLKKTALIGFWVCLLISCVQVGEIIPLRYPDGDIPPLSEAGLSYAEPSLEPIIVSPYELRTIPPSDLSEVLELSEIPPHMLSTEDKLILSRYHACFVEDTLLSGKTTFYDAYVELFERQWPILLTSDFVADRFYTMFHALFNAIEDKHVKTTLHHLLQEMIHTSLEQYLHSYGDLKETAWRNTAFLCVAHRLLDPNAPTPFIVSGIVRQELDLINEASGESASPLFALDAKKNPCLYKDVPGCIDYSIFDQARLKSIPSDDVNLRLALLWLTHISFSLNEKYPLLQSLLLTDCVKRTHIQWDSRSVPAWSIWLSIARFYSYLHGVEVEEYHFPEVDAILQSLFPKSFDESYFLAPGKLKAMESENSEWAEFMTGRFRFFPVWEDNLFPYFRPLLVPELGPDMSSPLFSEYLLKNLSPTCFPTDNYTYEIGGMSRCVDLSPEDIRFLFCNAMNLSLEKRQVMNVFRSLPEVKDIIEITGWNSPLLKNKYRFCKYRNNFNILRDDLQNRTPKRWVYSLTDTTIYTILKLNPSFLPGSCFDVNSIWREKVLTTALCLLPQIERSNPQDGRYRAPARINLSETTIALEPSPFLYDRLRHTTDYLRKKIMLLGYSSLELDDILIKYIDIADQLKNISLTIMTRSKEVSSDTLFLQSLLQRFLFVENQLSNYLNGDKEYLPERTFPRTMTLWESNDTNTKLLGITGNFYLYFALVQTNGGIRLFTAPQPRFYELEASKTHDFKDSEIRELLSKGIPQLVTNEEKE